jgi:hypothetical protein
MEQSYYIGSICTIWKLKVMYAFCLQKQWMDGSSEQLVRSTFLLAREAPQCDQVVLSNAQLSPARYLYSSWRMNFEPWHAYDSTLYITSPMHDVVKSHVVRVVKFCFFLSFEKTTYSSLIYNSWKMLFYSLIRFDVGDCKYALIRAI